MAPGVNAQPEFWERRRQREFWWGGLHSFDLSGAIAK